MAENRRRQFTDVGRSHTTLFGRSWDLDTGRLQQLVLNSEVGVGDQ